MGAVYYMNKPDKHTITTLSDALIMKEIDYVIPKEIIGTSVRVIDTHYGEYTVDLKSFCVQTDFVKHKGRRHADKMQSAITAYVGKKIGASLITDVFYGPDRGYKNRSFYLEFTASCGHIRISTAAFLKKNKESDIECQSCSATVHGERKKSGNKLLKRTTTYVHWQRIRFSLPNFLQDFADFKRILGDKPYPRAEVVIHGTTASWTPLTLTVDKETNLIASAIRQAFRHSYIYKATLEKAKVEDNTTTKYRCAHCEELSTLNNIQVDHIDPIQPICGRDLHKEELIDRIWTDKIQVLDRVCHAKKSTAENAERRKNKKSSKNKVVMKW